MSSVSAEPGVAWLTAGDPSRLTGGNVYNRHMIDALRRGGLSVTEIALSADGDLLQWPTALGGARVAVVDSIAISRAREALDRLGRHAPAIALLHMLPSEYARRRERDSMRSAERAVLRSVDSTVAVSECVRTQALDAGARASTVSVIPPGCDAVSTGLPDRARAATRFVRALCVANWEPRKGIHTLVAALARAPSVRVDFVGEPGSTRYTRWVQSLIQRYGLGARVRVHGPLAGADLAALYASSDLFVLPSYIETYGIAYAEALAHGLPVIGCRVGVLSWLVEHGCGVLVKPGDARGLGEAMERLAEDGARRLDMSRRARERARRLPTWRSSEEAFVDVVHRILA